MLLDKRVGVRLGRSTEPTAPDLDDPVSTPDCHPVPPSDSTYPQDRRSDEVPLSAPPTRVGTWNVLSYHNFRLFLGGLLVTGIGAWVARIGQDWLVLTLTDSPTAVGIVTACQFLPTLLLGLHGGLLADRFPKRRILQCTQGSMALLSAGLAALVLSGHVQAWHIYVLALGLGVATAIDNPVRQSFVSEIVGVPQLRGAISMVSSTFQLGALVGPVVGGVLVAVVGPGYAFVVNSVSFLGPLVALALMRTSLLHEPVHHTGAGSKIRDGLRYAGSTPSVLWPTVMVGTFGFFSLSLPVTLAAFAKNDFDSGPSGVGLLNGAVAAGALVGAITTARRRRDLRLRTIASSAGLLAVATVLASSASSQFALVVLVSLVGAANLAFLTSAQSLVQLTTPDHLRGRVVGVYMLAFVGSGALGGPVVGFIDEHFGARMGLLVAGVVPALVTLLVIRHLAQQASVRVGLTRVNLQLLRPAVVSRRS